MHEIQIIRQHPKKVLESLKHGKIEGMELAVGTLANGEVVLVAKTPKGEGYTKYATAHEALTAYTYIVKNANLGELVK